MYDNVKYSNGFALRNKYEHGKSSSYDDNEVKRDYYLGVFGIFEILYKISLEVRYNKLISD